MKLETVYRERQLGLANMLAANPQRHDQSVWGRPAPANECGTAGCAAGWSRLAAAGIVTIAPDGEMTWNEDAKAPPASRGSYAWDDLSTEERQARTLWRHRWGDGTKEIARKWLGLSPDMANTLFIRTTYLISQAHGASPEEAAIELLRRFADGRLNRRAGGPQAYEPRDADGRLNRRAGGPLGSWDLADMVKETRDAETSR